MPRAVTNTSRNLHRWFGIAIAIPMLLQGTTGAFLVASEKLGEWRAPHVAAAASVDPQAVIVAAEAAAPSDLALLRYTAPGDGRAASVDFGRPGSRKMTLRIWVDPNSRAVLREDRDPRKYYDWFHALHETLFLPFGHTVIGWFGIVLAGMIVTGFIIWLPPVGRVLASFVVNRRARDLRLLRELHGAVAAWVMLPLLFQAVSGMSMSFPNQARALLGMPQAAPHGGGGRHGAGHAGGEHQATLDIRAVIASATGAMPGATIDQLRFPPAPGRPVMALMRAAGASEGAPGPVVMVSVDGHHVMSTDDPSRSSSSAILGWARRIHGAGAGGPVWAAIEFLTGLALPLLGITGVWFWGLRKIRTRRKAQGRVAANTPSFGGA